MRPEIPARRSQVYDIVDLVQPGDVRRFRTMALERDAYLALEDVVGPDFITEDTALLDTYTQCWGNRLFYDDKFATRPGAVLLPETTEEVQTIVRVCNRYGILFKPFSSGFENVSVSLADEKSSPSRPAPDGPHHRHRREEHAGGRRAIRRHLPPAAGAGEKRARSYPPSVAARAPE